MENYLLINIYTMVLANVCSPALIYLVFSLTQVTIDTLHGHYNKAFIKMWVCMIFTLLLNHLSQRGLGLVSWLIVFIPFLLMSIVVTMLLVMFGLDPETGKLAIYDKTNNRPFTSDESLFEIMNRKENITNQLLRSIKEASFDVPINIFSLSSKRIELPFKSRSPPSCGELSALKSVLTTWNVPSPR